jgi:hypothetical protein
LNIVFYAERILFTVGRFGHFSERLFIFVPIYFLSSRHK